MVTASDILIFSVHFFLNWLWNKMNLCTSYNVIADILQQVYINNTGGYNYRQYHIKGYVINIDCKLKGDSELKLRYYEYRAVCIFKVLHFLKCIQEMRVFFSNTYIYMHFNIVKILIDSREK